MKRDDIALIRKVILLKVKEATTGRFEMTFSEIVRHEQFHQGSYVYYRIDYPALFGWWFDPEEAGRLKMIRFTDGAILLDAEVYLHDLVEKEAVYNYANKTLLLKKLAGEIEKPVNKETVQ